MPHAQALEHLQAGRPQAAVELLTLQLRTQPADAKGWFLLGACRHALGELPAAAEAFARSISLDPARLDAHLAYATVLRSAGDFHGALAASRRAQSRFTKDARPTFATALCLEDLDRPEEALAQYDTALQLAPDSEDALQNRGLLLARMNRLDDAVTNHHRYVHMHPRVERAYGALADMLLAQEHYAEVIAVLDASTQHVPQHALTLARRGVACAAMRHYDAARTDFAEALRRDPASVAEYLRKIAPGSDPELLLSPENIFLSRAWARLGHCDWSQWTEFSSELKKVAANPAIAAEPAIAFMSRLAPLSGTERHAVARRVAARIEARCSPLDPRRGTPEGRIRIGILSPDFREHLNAYLILPLFELVDRSRFSLCAYSLSPDDGSAIRGRVRASADRFVDLHDTTDQDAALAIRKDNVDILVDLGGHTTGARFAIAAYRPASLNVNYLGFSSSLASPRVDYAIVDRIVGAEDGEWTESRVYLPDTHFLYDYRGQPQLSTVSRDDYGLPDDKFTYCAFHRAEKISPDVFELWMRILAQVPRSVLWFRALSEQTARNLRARAAERGVDPGRLVFAPFEPSHDPRYLARHRLGDLMLDSLHHNAMTSACDALGAGLPVLTLRGTALAARAGESLVRAAGLPELVTDDQETYVRTAVRLATDRSELHALKKRLAANRRTAPLFDTAGRVRALEAAFQEMYDRMMRGEPPASFDVQP